MSLTRTFSLLRQENGRFETKKGGHICKTRANKLHLGVGVAVAMPG